MPFGFQTIAIMVLDKTRYLSRLEILKTFRELFSKYSKSLSPVAPAYSYSSLAVTTVSTLARYNRVTWTPSRADSYALGKTCVLVLVSRQGDGGGTGFHW